MAKQAQVFTVRDAQGQFLGTYRRLTARQAIRSFLDDQAVHAAAFRRSCPMPHFDGLTAAIEQSPW